MDEVWKIRVRKNEIAAEIAPLLSAVKNDDAKIIARIEELIKGDEYENLFWDNAVIDSISSLDPIKVYGIEGLYEIDTVEELRGVEILLSK